MPNKHEPDRQDDHSDEIIVAYSTWVKRAALWIQAQMPWADIDDLIQWGVIALMETLDKYDPSQGTLKAFAHKRVCGAMIDGLRKNGSQKRVAGKLEDEYHEDDAIIDQHTPLDHLIRKENEKLLSSVLEEMTKEETTILSLYYVDQFNNREISQILSIDEPKASRSRKRALGRAASMVSERLSNNSKAAFQS